MAGKDAETMPLRLVPCCLPNVAAQKREQGFEKDCVCGRGARQKTRKERGAIAQTRQAAWQDGQAWPWSGR